MLNKIWELLKGIWNSLKKIFIAVFDFFANIVNWFKAKYFGVKQKYPNAKAVSLKLKSLMEEGQYNQVAIGLNENSDYIANTFYDESTGEIIEEETEIIETKKLDTDTLSKFGNKALIVLT